MSVEEDDKALIRRFYRKIDASNIDAMDELVAEDYLNHDPPPFPGLAPGTGWAEGRLPDVLGGHARDAHDRGSDRGRGPARTHHPSGAAAILTGLGG